MAGAAQHTDLDARLARILDAVGIPAGGLVERRRPLPAAVAALHRLVLEGFLALGGPPDAVWLGEAANRTGVDVDVDAGLELLAEVDLIGLDDLATITAAYPFSGVATRHAVTLDGSPTVASMCAIDAIAIPLVTDRIGVVVSEEPESGAEIRVAVVEGEARWDPPEAVTVFGRTRSSGPLAAACCSTMDAFTSRGAAERYLAAHPEVEGEILDQAESEAVARAIFDGLL